MKLSKEFTLSKLLNPTTDLARLYHNKLPKRGWAGKRIPTEKEFVRLVRIGSAMRSILHE